MSKLHRPGRLSSPISLAKDGCIGNSLALVKRKGFVAACCEGYAFTQFYVQKLSWCHPYIHISLCSNKASVGHYHANLNWTLLLICDCPLTHTPTQHQASTMLSGSLIECKSVRILIYFMKGFHSMWNVCHSLHNFKFFREASSSSRLDEEAIKMSVCV